MKLTDYLNPALTLVLDAADSREALLQQLSDHVASEITTVDGTALYEALMTRESKGCTAMPEGVAIPHAMSEGLADIHVVAVRLKKQVVFDPKTGVKVDLVFMLIGSSQEPWKHVRLLARLARICHVDRALQAMRQATTAESLYECLLKEDDRYE